MDTHHPDIQEILAREAKQRQAVLDRQRAAQASEESQALAKRANETYARRYTQLLNEQMAEAEGVKRNKFPLERLDDHMGNPSWFWPCVLAVIFLLFGLAGATEF